MARESIQLPIHKGSLGTWNDLSMTAQWLSIVIARDHHTDTAGVSFFTTARWAHTARDITTAAAEVAVRELVDAGRLVVDDHHSYAWLVDYMANNGAFRQPNMIRGALKGLRVVTSPAIREAVIQHVAENVKDSAALTIGRSRPRKNIAPRIRLAVFERDAWSCGDCRRCVKPVTDAQRCGDEAPYDEAGWLELDHIHPHSQDGADTAENLRALCTRCNRVKSARLLAEVTG